MLRPAARPGSRIAMGVPDSLSAEARLLLDRCRAYLGSADDGAPGSAPASSPRLAAPAAPRQPAQAGGGSPSRPARHGRRRAASGRRGGVARACRGDASTQPDPGARAGDHPRPVRRGGAAGDAAEGAAFGRRRCTARSRTASSPTSISWWTRARSSPPSLALRGCGIEMGHTRPPRIWGEYALASADQLVKIDLHWRLAPDLDPLPARLRSALGASAPGALRRRRHAAAGRRGSPADPLLLCHQGAVVGLAQLPRRPGAAAACPSPSIDWDAVMRRAREMRASGMMLLALALTRRAAGPGWLCPRSWPARAGVPSTPGRGGRAGHPPRCRRRLLVSVALPEMPLASGGLASDGATACGPWPICRCRRWRRRPRRSSSWRCRGSSLPSTTRQGLCSSCHARCAACPGVAEA